MDELKFFSLCLYTILSNDVATKFNFNYILYYLLKEESVCGVYFGICVYVVGYVSSCLCGSQFLLVVVVGMGIGIRKRCRVYTFEAAFDDAP